MSGIPLTLGTAGHIDHGKTALVEALTGAQTDRLPQEQLRGISIELGYAQLTLPCGRRLSVVDAPGHERFVRTMVAGATGIDLYLMTVAADDGVMPQTREHATVLRALAVRTGVVAVTKSDLADPSVAMIEASELLPDAEVVPVSVRTGEGLDRLLAAIERAAQSVPGRASESAPARLHVDRVFTIKGAGTVVTGTLWNGSIVRGEEVELLPAGRRARVRGVEVHGQTLECAPAGQRVAVNLAGVARDEVSRGDVVAASGSDLKPTYLIDSLLEFSPAHEPRHGARMHVHHGTRESPARLAWLGGRYWQLRLEQPLVPAPGDRLVIRQIAPPDTIGGGSVLDAHPRKHGPSRELLARLERLASGAPPQETNHGPGASGQPDERDSGIVPVARLTPGALALERQLRDAGFQPPLDSELDPVALAVLRSTGRAVRVARNLHYHPQALSEARRRVIELAEGNGGAVTIAQLRDTLGTSRKFAQALLEHFDSEKVTIRRGDEHVLRRTARSVG